jgi:ATP-dependent DNA helicase RecG
MHQNSLKTKIEFLKGIGPQRGEALRKKLNIHTFYDLLQWFPFRYVDKSKVFSISEIRSSSVHIQVKGLLSDIRETGQGRGKRLTARLSDSGGSIELVWFKGVKWVQRTLESGRVYLVYGKPNFFKGKFSIPHPELELIEETHSFSKRAAFQAVYSSGEELSAVGLDSKGISKLQKTLWNTIADEIQEIIPPKICRTWKLLDRKSALENIHFPANNELLEKAVERLKFEELFLIQMELLLHKQRREISRKGLVFTKVADIFNDFYQKHLPFELTQAQKNVIREIRMDMKSGKQMNRLLQGDVGSGKTMVAFMSMLIALDNGFQSCIMAPTEILALQHYQSISEYCRQLGIETALLTGSSKTAERRSILEKLEKGDIQILTGTHALIEDKVRFKKLGLAVVDEQHRFGVAQRAKLWKKSSMPPHILVMTATPIPRTLAMTLYGDLEVSVIDQLPPGRTPVKTLHFFERSRLKVIDFIEKLIKRKEQVFIVYPLIEESEKLDYANLMDGYDAVCRDFPRPQYHVGIVHGKMKSADKELEMRYFREGKMNILVSTTVIEVGVDIPNATAMIIESAERFGLSQLHQLRGRVGRSNKQSYCILMSSDNLSDDARTRMSTMVEYQDGFKIAEVDLKLRGPGDMAGTKQSGMFDFKIADLTTDAKILSGARHAAKNIIDEDPALKKEENACLKNYIMEFRKERLIWSEIS